MTLIFHLLTNNNRRQKKRIEKAIYKIPDNKTRLITLLGNYIRNGALIHGYGLSCLKQYDMRVAHYTRSDDDLNARITNFWKQVHGLSKRFNNKIKINGYLKERNRTEFEDDTRKWLEENGSGWKKMIY